MNLNSLSTKITIIFVFVVALFIATFVFYIDYEKKQFHSQASSYHEKLAQSLMKMKLPPPEIINYLKDFNFEIESNHRPVIKQGKIVFAKRGFETILYKNNYYFHFITPYDKLLFKDKSRYEQNYYGHVLFGFMFAMILILYFWLMKSLKPLRDLKQEICKFADGDFDIKCKSNKKDEIADVANEFDDAAKKIKLLLESRQLFLRTIMHELKTPIAKGRIVSELIDDEKQRDRIIIIFEKLNQLIDDFAKIEQIVSHNYQPNIYACRINNIVERAIDILMLENNDNITIENISDKKLNVDMELIAFAVKNLLDNALKYSKDVKVTVREEADRLLVISNGDKLSKTLEEYYKPFHSDTKAKNHGMGLGLYIVHSILQMHGMKLEYEYKENQNIFKVVYSR